MSIRTRLLLLVFAVWLPAVAGFALLARSNYLKEEAAARQNIGQLGQTLNSVVERELDKRAVMATTLSGSSELKHNDLAGFHREARPAARGSDSWVVLVDRGTQYVNSGLPEPTALARASGAPFSTVGVAVFLNRQPAASKASALGLFAAQADADPVRYNVGVYFDSEIIQSLIGQYKIPPGAVATVVDQHQRVIARSRDPAKWFGQEASGEVKRRAVAGQEGFTRSVTLDGVPSLTYLSRPNRYQWNVVLALPLTALAQAARRVTLQAFAASGTLLLIGLALALYAARRISAPVLALKEAAAELGRDGVPPRLSTGVRETDAVSEGLHRAGLRAQESSRVLIERVAEAVRQAEQAQARLLEGQKHEAIGRLTGGLAHDFNNLLQTISMGLQVLERSTPDGPQRTVLQAGLRACSKAADLVRQMLTFGRAQPLQARPIRLGDFVLASRELIGKALGERVRLTTAIEPGLPAVLADPTQLELALLNLIFNARDAMPQGGNVAMTARPATTEEAGTAGTGEFVCIEVSDDGPGMDEATAARAFEPYFTTKPVGTGSGLGLSQVFAFARQSGGEARLATALGQGTRVSLLLPVTREQDAVEARPAPATSGHRTLRILMVEDDVLVSSVVAPALEGVGHQVRLCRTADEAQSVLVAEQPGAYDVLFTDVVMPGSMTGLDLVAWCRSQRPALPVLVTTGYTTQAIDPQVKVLRKPYDLEALYAALAGAIADEPSAVT